MFVSVEGDKREVLIVVAKTMTLIYVTLCHGFIFAFRIENVQINLSEHRNINII